MPVTLVLNFEAKWNFRHLCQCHGLDLYLETRVVIWDISGSTDPAESSLDWPRALSTSGVPQALEELLNLPGECPKNVIVLCAFISEPDWDMIAKVLDPLPPDVKRYILCSRKNAPNERPAVTAAFMTSESDARKQYYIFRVLLEMLEKDPGILNDLPPVEDPICVDFYYSDEINDRVQSDWPPLAAWLLRQCREILRLQMESGEQKELDDQIGVYLQQSLDLLKDEYPLPETDHEKTLVPSLPRAPFFFRKTLDPSIREAFDELYDSLEGFLKNLYRGAEQERDNHRGHLNDESRRLYSTIEENISPTALGFGESGVNWLEKTLSQTGEYLHQVQITVEESSGNMEMAKPRGGCCSRNGLETPLFDLMRFPEDEKAEEKRNRACRLAGRLASAGWVLASTAGACFLGTLPSAARWIGGGASPFSGLLDSLWVSLFGGIFLFPMLIVAWWRRRALRQSLKALDTALREAAQRHMDAYREIFRYLSAREALKRINYLTRLCQRRLAEIEREVRQTKDLEIFLDKQLEYYQQWAYAETTRDIGSTPQLSSSIEAWLGDTLQPLYEQWKRDPGVEIQILDERVSGPSRVIECAYYKSAFSLTLRTAGEE